MTLQEFRQRYQYDLEKDKLGEGGFAKVFRAYDTKKKRTVALKFYAGNIGERYGLREEMQKVTDCQHTNLIEYYDLQLLTTPDAFDADAKTQVAVIEYANAGDLNDFMKSFPSMENINRVVAGILQGLAYLHEKGIVHRDIKPQNILMHKTANIWTAKIADFGLAKQLNQGLVSSKLLGTMEYMAPEQFDVRKYGKNRQLSTNVDLWSLGGILYEMFLGELPFGGRNDGISQEQVMRNILQKPITKQDLTEVPPPYNQIIAWCLIKNAALRVQTADELLNVLNGTSHFKPDTIDTAASTPKLYNEEDFSTAEKVLLFMGNVAFSPLVSIIIHFVVKKQAPQKSRTALSIAWWSVAAWLAVLLLIVLVLIIMESDLLEQLRVPVSVD